MTKNPYKAYQKQEQGSSYQNVPQPGNPAYTEAWALIEAARRMAESLQAGEINDMGIRRNIRDALRLNWRLWTIFQSELTVGERETPLPEDIRLNILSLCKFVDTHTIQVMSDITAEGVVALIDINRNIASGLLEQFTQGEEDGKQKQPAAEPEPETPDQPVNLDENI